MKKKDKKKVQYSILNLGKIVKVVIGDQPMNRNATKTTECIVFFSPAEREIFAFRRISDYYRWRLRTHKDFQYHILEFDNTTKHTNNVNFKRCAISM